MSHYAIKHGEAVAIGIALDAFCAMRRGLITRPELDRLIAGLRDCGLQVWDAWLEQQLKTESSQSKDLEKLLRLELLKKSQAEHGIAKIQEGWEKGLYKLEEVQSKIAGYRATITKIELEENNLRSQMVSRGIDADEIQALRRKLEELRNQNLLGATFEEKTDLIAKLGIKILPSEDLKSRKVLCRLNLLKVDEERDQSGLAKVTFGGPQRTIPRTFELSFKLNS
jgi:leucyl aminopeptidase